MQKSTKTPEGFIKEIEKKVIFKKQYFDTEIARKKILDVLDIANVVQFTYVIAWK